VPKAPQGGLLKCEMRSPENPVNDFGARTCTVHSTSGAEQRFRNQPVWERPFWMSKICMQVTNWLHLTGSQLEFSRVAGRVRRPQTGLSPYQPS